jgi:O-antigen/teichoic acid export membrane protein
MIKINNRYLQNILQTFVSRIFLLGLNFSLVILTTQLWGAEGRGLISILIADVAIIVILNNVLSESSISYMVPKVGLSPLILPAYFWILVFSALGAGFFSFLHHLNFFILFGISLLTSLLSVNLMALVGKQKIKSFNYLTIIVPLFHITIISFFWLGGFNRISFYFLAAVIALAIVYAISCFQIKSWLNFPLKLKFSQPLKQTFSYGLKNEISSLLQFLNYRASYFLILFFANDFRSLGIFSIGIAVAESIWAFSRSVSINQYSKLINLTDISRAKDITAKSAKISGYMSIAMVIIILLLPNQFYGWVFGPEFYTIKNILIIIVPGIITMAIANIYAHHFSALGNQRLLIARSVIGLIVNIVLSLLLIPVWDIEGACVAVSLSYLVSSAFIAVMFYKERKFTFKDLWISKQDLRSSDL